MKRDRKAREGTGRHREGQKERGPPRTGKNAGKTGKTEETQKPAENAGNVPKGGKTHKVVDI